MPIRKFVNYQGFLANSLLYPANDAAAANSYKSLTIKLFTNFAMMKKILIIVFIFSIFSCREDPTVLRQRDLISRRKLVQILTEIHLMDAMSTNQDNYSFFPQGDSINIYSNIFKKYKVTPAEFDSTIAMYSRRPDLFVKIYNDVISRLNYINDTLNKNDPLYLQEHSPSYIKK